MTMLDNDPNSRKLQLYIPPTGKYNPELVKSWMEFVYDLVETPQALTEFFASHAYRFRNPTEFIEKFFVNYGKGHNGKTYLAACMAELYPNFSNAAVSLAQITNDSFNAWLTRNLFIWMEEVENKTYQTKDLQKHIKLMTTKLLVLVECMQKQDQHETGQ